LIIDGHTAFTGGVNLADEYINKKRRFGHWKDTAIMVKGEAVNSFTLMFLQMWNIDSKNKETYGRYMFTGNMIPDRSMREGGYIVPYGDSPLDNEEVGEKVYIDIINKAKDYVHIMTPYLIIDEELVNSLIFASQRGVDVKIMLPHIPDKKYAYWLARTHYEDLISEGVEVYEYTPGFVHAKVFTSDDEKAVVGTINMDYRSFIMHFECGVWMCDNKTVFDVKEHFSTLLLQCEEITLRKMKKSTIFTRLKRAILHFFAPFM
jgi:cardiolipin synthase